nr:MAG TPA: hypothetical protein [Bacteriophage sp.]
MVFICLMITQTLAIPTLLINLLVVLHRHTKWETLLLKIQMHSQI